MTALSAVARDRLAEQAWGVLVAAAREGITDPSVIAHAIIGNQLPVVAELADQAAAEALERAAFLLCDLALDRDDGALEDHIAAIWADAEKLRARAAALAPTTEGTAR